MKSSIFIIETKQGVNIMAAVTLALFGSLFVVSIIGLAWSIFTSKPYKGPTEKVGYKQTFVNHFNRQ